jgi:hypothetical protein
LCFTTKTGKSWRLKGGDSRTMRIRKKKTRKEDSLNKLFIYLKNIIWQIHSIFLQSTVTVTYKFLTVKVFIGE